ncbi:MAG: glucosylglycerol hydrolase [Cyanobacteria bacterium J06560_5]
MSPSSVSSATSIPPVELQTAETEALMAWAVKTASSKRTYFEIGQKLATRLGAHPVADGLTEIGFWVPELANQLVASDRAIYLEIFTPVESVDFKASQQEVSFRYECVAMPLQGEFVWGVVSGMQMGSRDRLGSLYWLRYRDLNDGLLYTARDIAPYSLPYGVFAPAELYDIGALQQNRGDLDYLRTRAEAQPVTPAETGEEPALPREPAPSNILQIHIPTASAEGTLAGLGNIYRQIASKLNHDEPLTAAEQHYVGYDAIQFLPTEPTIEHRAEDSSRDFFTIVDLNGYGTDGPVCTHGDTLLPVRLRKPDTQNWGYDVPIIGSSTTNPSILSTLRPDEVIDFIADMHTLFEQPIQVIYDLVYGHSDNQALDLISRQFLAGPNMYGQDLLHTLPMVRSILLEMQRRKMNTGIDGIRIDGGQDFKFFNPFSGRLEYDDNYLMAMSDVIQDIHGYQRLMFTIFEDGRPWPDDGWEISSTYRELIDLRPDSFQWGPLIFAHNTPAIKGFWDYKWPRVCEIMQQGDRWITGCGNHDTVRRGNQIAIDTNINWNQGKTIPEVLNNAYDNPATTLWVYGFSPGLPMDFLNAVMHSGWGFFRNTDDLYGVKVVAEELGFLDWQVTAEFYDKPQFFKHLKRMGFESLASLQGFAAILDRTTSTFEFDLDLVAEACRKWALESDGVQRSQQQTLPNSNNGPLQQFFDELNAAKLKDFALAFMEDSHEFSRVSHFFEEVNQSNRDNCELDSQTQNFSYGDAADQIQRPSQRAPRKRCGNRAAFNLALRNYRQANPWLAQNLSPTDRFNRISQSGYTLFYGVRTEYEQTEAGLVEGTKQIAMLAHMQGEPTETVLFDWLQLDPSEWSIVITSPNLKITETTELQGLTLEDGQAVLLEKIA